MPRLLLLLSLLAFTTPALASDGVFEINQTCAVNTGCFSEDTPGFPVTVNASGSYRLTGHLFVTGANVTVIEITTGDVTLDLNGFSIRCLFFGPPCAGNGTGIGIDADRENNVTVLNGTVRDIAGAAIVVGPGGVVDRVRAIANGSGLNVTQGYIRDCLAEGNLGAGFFASETVVRDSISRNNGTGLGCGAAASAACVLEGVLIKRNTTALSGSVSSLGHNRSCDVDNLSCVAF